VLTRTRSTTQRVQFARGSSVPRCATTAKRRLADEYDAAQERGEIRTQRDNQAFSGVEKASGPEVVPPKELHEARIIRDAEVADPGIVRRANPRPRTSGPAPARGGTSAGPNASPLEVPMRAAPG
jgi:hypothetical protein